MSITWLSVEPLDTIMIRDGRSFVAGDTNRAQARIPAPCTLGGAVGKALGRRVEGRLLGPVVTVGDVPRFPAPADIVHHDDPDLGPSTRRLAAVEREDGEVSDLDDRMRLSHALVGEGDPVGGWITSAGMSDWLGHRTIQAGRELDRDARRYLVADPWTTESRVGLARIWDGPLRGSAAPSLLYSADHLRPAEDVRFLVGCPDDGAVHVVNDSVPFGGQGRHAHVRVDTDADPFPDLPARFPGGRVAVYLATPALFDDVLWVPVGTSATLCALAMTGPVPIATASRLGGWRRRLRWAVPAGSVYYLRFATADDAGEWAGAQRYGLLPQTEDDMVTAGFGTCLIGSW